MYFATYRQYLFKYMIWNVFNADNRGEMTHFSNIAIHISWLLNFEGHPKSFERISLHKLVLSLCTIIGKQIVENSFSCWF